MHALIIVMHFCPHRRRAQRLLFAGAGIAVLVLFTFLVFKPHLVRHNEQAFLRDPFAGHPRPSPHHTGNAIPTKVCESWARTAVFGFCILSVAHVP